MRWCVGSAAGEALPGSNANSRNASKGAIIMDRYYIVATIYPKAGKEEAVKAELLKNIPEVRKEAGCLWYDLHELKAGGRFMFYEIWENKAAFEAHGAAPHMVAYRERIKDLLEKPTEISVWSAADVAR